MKPIPILTEADKISLTVGQIPKRLMGQEMIPVLRGLVKRVPRNFIDNPHILPGLQENVTNLERQTQKCLGCEDELRKILNINLLNTRRQEKLIRGATITGLPYIDPSFLAWKNSEGFPLFAVYSTMSPTANITVANLRSTFTRFPSQPKVSTNVVLVPDLPPFMRRYYIDQYMESTLASSLIKHRAASITYTSKYQGAMPDAVRDRIHTYSSSLSEVQFNNIFIIAEAPRWEASQIVPIPVGDPIVVGVMFDTLWVIDFFDLTPSEEVALRLCQRSVGEKGVPHQKN